MYLAIRNLFYYKVLNFKIILIVTCLSTTFLSIDIFVQHIYKKDIFGFEPWHGRYAGLFIDEAIAGSYIQKFSFISILTVFVLNISTIQKKLLINIIVIVLGLGILMSTDRAPFIVYLFQVIILIILSAKFRSIYLISFILLCVISILIFKNNSVIKDRYLFLNNLVNFDQEIYTDPNSKLNDKVEINYNHQFLNKKIFQDDYFKIFYSGYVVWKENPILGTGNKSFNKSCSKLLEMNKDILCAPHTHNLYLEILVNIGGIGFFLFLSFVFSIFFTIKKNFSYNPKIYLFIIIILIAELLPLRSYGSIFTTVNGSIFWYLLALASSNLHVKK